MANGNLGRWQASFFILPFGGGGAERRRGSWRLNKSPLRHASHDTSPSGEDEVGAALPLFAGCHLRREEENRKRVGKSDAVCGLD